jgi:hypothetical protein
MVTFGAMITTWGRSPHKDSIEKAEGYLQRLKDIHAETGDSNFLPTVVQYTATIQAWANRVRSNPEQSKVAVERVDALLQELLSSDVPQMKPNTLTFAAVLKTIAGARRIPDQCDRAENVLRIMTDTGVEITPYIIGIVKKCCAQEEKKATTRQENP